MITGFLSDGVEEIMDYDGRTGAASMRYFHGSGVDELLAWQDVAGGVIQQPASDQLGSVVAQQLRWGAITETWRYSAYGVSTPLRHSGARLLADFSCGHTIGLADAFFCLGGEASEFLAGSLDPLGGIDLARRAGDL